MPFRPGKSGNPKGRPHGARNRTTLAIERLLDGEAKAITRKAIEMALGGDATMLRFFIDRIAPPRKDRPVRNIAFGLLVWIKNRSRPRSNGASWKAPPRLRMNFCWCRGR